MRNLKRALSLGLTAAMISGLMVMGSSAASYADVADTDNVEAIDVLEAVGIMIGDENGNFNPDQNVTRNEMAVVMSNLMEYNVASYKGTSPFTDVPSWAEPYVAACYTNGITAGTSATTYGGSDTVTTAQAALMLMKALGYFQYQQDFGSDWQLATTRQGNAIDLFNGVDAGVTQAMTRNDVAQLVLNTLESGMVTPTTSGSITVGGVTIANSVEYNYVTSNAGYARSISEEKSTTNTTDAQSSIVELGEDLYQGDLTKTKDHDAFGRPAAIWAYQDDEIGTYVDDRTQTWTTKVTERDLYRSAGTAAVNGYDWTIWEDGKEIDSYVDGYDLDRNDTDRWQHTGNGVLTEMFVDTVAETVDVTLIHSYVAEVTRVQADAEENDYNITVNYKTQPAGVAMDRQFNSATEFAQGDIVIVNAAQGNIEAMTLAETVEGTVEGVKANDYLRIGGTPYNYNYAYTTGGILRGYSDTVKGLYDLENSVAANPSAGDEVVIYLDANGSVVAIADAGLVAEDYIYVKGVHLMYGDYSARVVHYDGTEEDVTIDEIDESRAYNASLSGNEYIAYTDTNKMGLGVYKYNASSNDYDLYTEYNNFTGEQFEADALTSVKIENGRARIGQYNDTTKAYYGQSWAVDNNTVFVDVVNNTTWTGYENVPTMSNVEGWAVIDGTNNSVVDVVFITNDNVRYEEDNDSYFVVTSSNPEESLLESSVASRSRAATTRASGTVWTYNVWINGEATTLEASQDLDLSIGVWKITGRDSNGLVKEVEQVLAEGSMIPFANFANFTTFATYRTADSLTLNDKTNSDLSTDVASDKQDHFAITTETVSVAARMNDDNDEVKDIVPGSLNDIQVANSTNPKDSSTSAVFVLNAEDDDWGTVAKLVLVVNPEPTSEGGSSSVSGVSDFDPVTNNSGTAEIRYYNVADADLINYIKNELAAYLGVSADKITYDAFNEKANVAGMSNPITVDLIEVFQVSDGVTTTYVDTGTTNVAPGADKLPAGNYLLDDVQADGTAITVSATGVFSNLANVTEDTDLVTAYAVTLGGNVAASATTEDGTSFSTGHYVADGVEVTVTSSAARTGLYALKITDADGNVTVGEPKNLSTDTANYTYVVRSAVTLDEARVADVTILGRDYGYKAVGDTITFTSDAAASAIIAKKGNTYAALNASVTATGTGFSYTVAVADMHTDNTITLVEAYTVAEQTDDVGIFTDAGCTQAITNGAYYEAGTTLYVKADAGETLDAATIAKLTATSVNGVYSFEVENTVANNAFTVE